MTHIKSHAENYAAMEAYLTPEQVHELKEAPKTPHQHALYATAHCLVSERHEKGDLVDMVYALLRKSSFDMEKCVHNSMDEIHQSRQLQKILAGLFSQVAKCEDCPCYVDSCKHEKKQGKLSVCANRITKYASYIQKERK